MNTTADYKTRFMVILIDTYLKKKTKWKRRMKILRYSENSTLKLMSIHKHDCLNKSNRHANVDNRKSTRPKINTENYRQLMLWVGETILAGKSTATGDPFTNSQPWKQWLMEEEAMNLKEN